MRSNSSFAVVTAFVLAAFFSTLASAQSAGAPPTAAEATATQPTREMTDGEVRKVDKETMKITLRHGEIKNLGMPAMSMVFQVKDPAMLDAVKPGDKVKFSAERTGGAMVVTHIETAK